MLFFFYFNVFIFKEPIRIGDVCKMGTMIKNWPFSFFSTLPVTLELRFCFYEFKCAYSGKSWWDTPHLILWSKWNQEEYQFFVGLKCISVRCSAGFDECIWGGLIIALQGLRRKKKALITIKKEKKLLDNKVSMSPAKLKPATQFLVNKYWHSHSVNP